jgi:hypothetical protein
VRDEIAEDIAKYRIEMSREGLGVFDIHEDRDNESEMIVILAFD